MTVRAARRIPDMQPGSPEWLRLMTASKVAAVIGVSPWESRFSLWHRLAGQLEAKPSTAGTRRGHYLEDGVAAYLGDQHPGLRFGRTGTWVNKARDWQSATPDRIARAGRTAVAVVEVKTAADDAEWGPDGTDQIPPYYRAQVVWQMDTLGLPAAYVGALLPRLQLRAYTIDYDRAEAEWLRAQARMFLNSLPGGSAEAVPDIDGHDATYAAVRQLHPDIDDRDVEVPTGLAAAYCAAVSGLRAAEDEHALRRAQLADLMGDAKTALWVDDVNVAHRIAGRQAKGTGTPFVKAASKLPDPTPLPETA